MSGGADKADARRGVAPRRGGPRDSGPRGGEPRGKSPRGVEARRNSARGTRIVASALLGLVFSAILFASGALGGMDRVLYDMIARIGARLEKAPGSAGRVELIYVDQYSLAWVEKNLGLGWPWPRELYGVMASFLSRAEAQAFDILFTEASPFGPGDDERCAEAMDAAGNVVVAAARDSRGERISVLPTRNVKYGGVAALIDSDGVLRRYDAGGAAERVTAFGDAKGDTKGDAGAGVESLGLAALERAGNPRAKSARGLAFLRFRGESPSFRARNAAEILASAMSMREGRAPQVDPADYAGAYVFVGFSAPGLLDRQAVPTDGAMPGAEIHATFVDNALRGRLLHPLSVALACALACVFGAAAAFASNSLKRPAALAAGAGVFAVAPLVLGLGCYQAGIATFVGLDLSSGIAAYFSGIILSYVAEGRNRAFLRRSFSQYLSPSVVDELVKDPELLRLGGEKRTITAFFSDIQGFTPLSESMTPERLASFMNTYLSVMTREILAEGGTLDKYVGDAVVAFWNAPLEQADHASRAVRAALACQEVLAASAEAFSADGAEVPITRIGIHTGEAIVGNMGSPSRFNYTAIGDVMNTASRLENANKAIGTRILVSGDTAAACASGGLKLRRLGEILVKGKTAPVEVWEPRLPDKEPCEGAAAPWSGVRDCRDA